MRIKFERGGQREFLDRVIEKLNSPSLRGLLQFGFSVNYSSLKNYYNEDRLLPEELFLELLEVSEISEEELDVKRVHENWGQVKGGKKSKK